MRPIAAAVAIPLFWAFCGVIAAGFANADFRCEYPALNSPKDRAGDWAFSIGWGLSGGPIALAASWVVSGGWYSGWTLSRTPLEQDECAEKRS